MNELVSRLFEGPQTALAQRDPAIVPSQSDDGIVQCVHCPDRRGGATPRQYALLLRPLKVARL